VTDRYSLRVPERGPLALAIPHSLTGTETTGANTIIPSRIMANAMAALAVFLIGWQQEPVRLSNPGFVRNRFASRVGLGQLRGESASQLGCSLLHGEVDEDGVPPDVHCGYRVLPKVEEAEAILR